MSIIRTNFRFLFPVATFTNFIAFLVGLMLVVVFRLFQINNTEIIFAALMATSFLVQTYLFKVKKITESQFVDSKWLKKTHKMTLKQLDHYCSFNYIGYGLIKVSVLILLTVGKDGPTSLSVGVLLFLCFLVLKQIAHSSKAIILPKGLFVKANPHNQESPGRWEIDYANQLATGITIFRRK